MSAVSQGSALTTGFAAASNILVMLDADGRMTPAEISRYLALLDDWCRSRSGNGCKRAEADSPPTTRG